MTYRVETNMLWDRTERLYNTSKGNTTSDRNIHTCVSDDLVRVASEPMSLIRDSCMKWTNYTSIIYTERGNERETETRRRGRWRGVGPGGGGRGASICYIIDNTFIMKVTSGVDTSLPREKSADRVVASGYFSVGATSRHAALYIYSIVHRKH